MASEFEMKTPVLIIVFNRPDTTMQVFDRIRKIRPPKLFIISDGARENRPDEAEKVAQSRAIKDMVDWNCEVHTNYSDVNLGCKNRIASGLTWAFEHVNELIILEDDCVPDLSFFRFCQELLEKYRDDPRIMSIAGYNADICEEFDESYTFARQFECWGWATWKRAWKLFDINMSYWQKFKQNRGYLNNIKIVANNGHLEREFQLAYEDKISSWAYRFYFSSIVNNGLHIIPKINMIRNIGFDTGRHTSGATLSHLYMNEAMAFPLKHPDIILPLDKEVNITPLPPPILEQTLNELDNTFKQFLELKQYHAILILFKKVLKMREMYGGRDSNLLTSAHYQFVYYAAIAYYYLKDYDHAAAMLSILVTVSPQNISILMLLLQCLVNTNDRYGAVKTVEQIKKLNISEPEHAELERLSAFLNN